MYIEFDSVYKLYIVFVRVRVRIRVGVRVRVRVSVMVRVKVRVSVGVIRSISCYKSYHVFPRNILLNICFKTT